MWDASDDGVGDGEGWVVGSWRRLLDSRLISGQLPWVVVVVLGRRTVLDEWEKDEKERRNTGVFDVEMLSGRRTTR